MWAAYCLAFFWFLSVSEFTTPSDSQYNKNCHLSINDISIHSRDNPQLLKVTLKQSKTDPFHVGVDLYLRVTGRTICPVKALLPYLAVCGQYKGPLFILEDGNISHAIGSVPCWMAYWPNYILTSGNITPTVYTLVQPPQQDKPISRMPSSNWWEDGRAMLTWPTLKPLLWNWLSSPNT